MTINLFAFCVFSRSVLTAGHCCFDEVVKCEVFDNGAYIRIL